jgi:electron transport complex protein RnfD
MFAWHDLLVGKQAAGIGNGLVLFLLIGGLFLLLIREISWQIPAGFIAGNALIALILGATNPEQFASPMFYLLSGGAVYAAFFLATDHTTSPVNPVPMLIYGFLGGALLMTIRAFSNFTDGVVFAILLVNMCTPLLDRMTPKVRGLEGAEHA